MKVFQAYRYELKPNNRQGTLLGKHAGVARFAYNWGLERRIREYQETGRSSNAIVQHRQLNRLKRTQYPWMYEVSKCAPQEALRDLDRAFSQYFRRRKDGKRRAGFPRFKKKGVHDAFRLTGAIRVFRRSIQLPRLGRIRVKDSTDVKGRILSATVKREVDRWFVSLHVKRERPNPEPADGPVVGVDLNVGGFVTSEGDVIVTPRPLKRSLRLLERRQKKHSRKRKGSRNRAKSAIRLGRMHRRVKNQRRDWLQKVTTQLARSKSVIVVENLNVSGLVQKGALAQAISDAGFAEFRRLLAYKVTWYGSELVVADRWYPSSKRCSSCGAVRETLGLTLREWMCHVCGATHDRDVNAAKNLVQIATDSWSESHACGDGRLQAQVASARPGSRKWTPLPAGVIG